MAQDARGSGWEGSRQLVQSIIDALPQHIAVLDQDCRIAANAAWRRFGLENGLGERAAGPYAEAARAAAAGVRAVAEGRRAAFELEYPWRHLVGCALPGRQGFGRSLIERSAAYQLDGRAWLEFRSEGVQCRIEAPLKAHPDG